MTTRYWILPMLAVTIAAAQPITIKHTTIMDGKGHVLKNEQIVVEGSRIAGVSGAKGKATYDLSGLTVMPGWIDTHTHPSWHFNKDNRLDQGGRNSKEAPEETAFYVEGNAYATLMGGFTTVQSLGSGVDKPLRDLINRGILPGPRIITSLRSVNENTGTPEQIRAYVRKMKDDGADVIKLFATKSIRDGGAQSMTDEQIQAACGEATALGLRSVVHAHASGGAKASVLAGCTSIEHGAFLDGAPRQLMADRGAYFDPNFLVLHNYLENKPKFLGLGNYTEAGFGYIERALPLTAEVLRRASGKGVKIWFGDHTGAGGGWMYAEGDSFSEVGRCECT